MADDADDAAERMEAETAALVAQSRARLREAAQPGPDCEQCSRPIPRLRRAAMPHARLCVSCQENFERMSR